MRCTLTGVLCLTAVAVSSQVEATPSRRTNPTEFVMKIERKGPVDLNVNRFTTESVLSGLAPLINGEIVGFESAALSQWTAIGGHGNYFFARLQIGTSPDQQDVCFDTGSADTWVVGSTCLSDQYNSCKPNQQGSVVVDSSFASTGVTAATRYGTGTYGVNYTVYSTSVSYGNTVSANLPVGVATYIFGGMSGTGILGLSFNDNSGIAHALDNANPGAPKHNANFLDHLGLTMFGVFIDPVEADVGEVSFGFYDSDKYPPGQTMQWFPIADFKPPYGGGFWQFNPAVEFIFTASDGVQRWFDYGAEQQSTPTGRVISDSGTPSLILTTTAANTINSWLNSEYDPSNRVVPCAGNPLIMKLISPSDYNNNGQPSVVYYSLPYSVLVQPWNGGCLSLISGGAERYAFTIFGAPFYQAAYSAYDKSNKRIGFVPQFPIPHSNESIALLGCYQDTEAHVMTLLYSRLSNITVAGCLADCRQSGYPFAGIKSASQCFCGVTLPSVASTGCSYTCSGGECGGPSSLSVYSRLSDAPTPTTIGCFQDSPTRVMRKLWQQNDATAKNCLADCMVAGYLFAGLEDGNECYCSQSLPTSTMLPNASCIFPCVGDSSQMCGGAWALSVVSNAANAPSKAVVSLGCFQDSETRTLPVKLWERDDATPALCLNDCVAAGYAYGGMEYGLQCFCGNTFPQTSLLQPRSCSMPCSGDTNQTCGGSWSLSVITNTALSLSNTNNKVPVSLGCYLDTSKRTMSTLLWIRASATPISCLTDCMSAGFLYAGLENSNECYCSKSLPSSLLPSSACSMDCSGVSGQSCGGSWALSVLTLAPSVKPPVSLGCFQDSQTRVLTRLMNRGSTTPSFCFNSCSASGFYYAGVENGNECWCGNSLPVATLPSSTCSTPCSGDTGQTCGGPWALNIFSTATRPPVASIDHGCFQDASVRTMPRFMWSRNDATPSGCLRDCVEAGYTYAGLEFSVGCYCSNSKPSKQLSNDSCNMPCSGDAGQICGGTWALTVVSNSS
ncbi:aspartic peptidase domain-containing protein [Chytriomyces sp. MP71]|nr:aspartic peptidase domain-containing protein [Chytriomyces sp. MP71]